MLWNRSYETGVEEIDKQNLDLLSRLEAMTGPDTDMARFEQLENFEKAAMEYFEREQAMHYDCRYSDADIHRYAHAGYLKHLRRIGCDYVDRGETLAHEMFFRKNAVESLKKHILNQDMSFAEFYKNAVDVGIETCDHTPAR